VFSYAQLGTASTTTPVPLRLAGLDDGRAYRVRWLRIGDDGLGPMKSAPPWLESGITLTGRQLATHGLTLPVLNPEHALLLELTGL
jgi:alpha-galactosidase